jgi:Fe-S-cluster-containing hydrogenase component 2
MQDASNLGFRPVSSPMGFAMVGPFPVIQLNRAETATSTFLATAYQQCSKRLGGSPPCRAACAASALQISAQATIVTARNECIQLAPAPIGVMAFRYTQRLAIS